MLTVRFHPDAFQELKAAQSWNKEQAQGLGDHFFNEVEKAINSITEFPDARPKFDYNTRRFLLHRFPYAIIYRKSKNILDIIAVTHFKRKPGYRTRRIQ